MNNFSHLERSYAIKPTSAFIYVLLTFSILLLFLSDSYSYGFYKIIEETFATFCTTVLIFTIIHFYIHRVKYISMQLMFSFIFSLIIGIPSIYLYFFKGAHDGFELVCIWGMLINIILYLTSTNDRQLKQYGEVNNFFKVIFILVAICQLFKIAIYLRFILSSGLGHLAIYTESDELLSSVPFAIRAIGGFSSVMGLAVFYYNAPRTYKFLGFVLLSSDLLLGIRNKFFFAFICILILSLYSHRKFVLSFFVKISRPQYIVGGFIGLSLVSYYREGYQINFLDYIVIVLDSLSSTLAGLQDLYSLPYNKGWALLDVKTVFSEILPLSGFGFINDTQISREYSTIVLGSVSNGIALSSSGMLEATVLSMKFNLFIYLAYLILVSNLIRKGLNSLSIYANFIAIAMISGFFYSVRGELILPFAYIIKSLPIISLAPLLITKTCKEKKC